ncbi:MAG: PP2C family serine/threonine-protein phosphatase [Pseudomonadota bacterium]
MRATTVAAGVRGTRHARQGAPSQDHFAAFSAPFGVALIVADGAGSAARGGVGAALGVRAARAALRQSEAGSVDDCRAACEVARARLHRAAAGAGRPPRDFATTLIVATLTEAGAAVAHVGDGAVVAKGAALAVLSAPDVGAFAGETTFLTSDSEIRTATAPATALAVFSDGLERLLIEAASGAPAPVFDRWFKILQEGAAGHDHALSAALRRYLAQPAVAERTDDDVTLCLAVRC